MGNPFRTLTDWEISTLVAAETWGVPPWVVERDGSVYWMERLSLFLRERERELERAARRKR
jgi:hypothetical protein